MQGPTDLPASSGLAIQGIEFWSSGSGLIRIERLGVESLDCRKPVSLINTICSNKRAGS